MKTTQRLLALLLALVATLTALPVGMTVAADTPDGYGKSILAQMDNAEALLYMYDVIAEAAYGTPATISLAHRTHKVTWDEACTVYDLVLSDHPDIFWHGDTYKGAMYTDGTAAAIYPSYTMTAIQVVEARAALEAQVAQMTADLEGKSDYDKSVLLHDRLAARTLYVLEGEHQTAYGALVQGTAVCAGYAKAYQLLMQRVGIPAWYVTGESVSPDGQVVGHAWNLVQLDGDWYYTDVTWDDQTNYTFYAYLNNTYEQIQESHTFGDYAAYLPAATATEHNYFVRNDLQMEQYAVEAMADVVRNHPITRVYVTGDKASFIQDYATFLFDLCAELNAPPGSVHYGHATLGREIIFILNIDHTCQYTAHTAAPTCIADGYTVEICSYDFCHKERNRTVLPTTGAHVYDNDCDADCNACGTTREAGEHLYDNPCDTDCNACGATRPLYLPGDANDDGTVNNRDLALLMRFLNGWSDPVLVDACDVNDDGAVNNRDLALLMRFLNGWDVTLK